VARSAGRLGNFRAIHTCYTRRSKNGVWQKIFEHLVKDVGNERAMIDSTVVRVHRHGAEATGETERKASGDRKVADHKNPRAL